MATTKKAPRQHTPGREELTRLAKRSIPGWSGPRKWGVARDFIAGLTDAQCAAFFAAYQELLSQAGDDPGAAFNALIKAGRIVAPNHSIAGELMAPPKDPRNYRMGTSKGRQKS